MDITLIIAGLFLLLVWVWMSFLGSVAAKYDSTLEPFQKKAQILISWLIPFIGPSFVLYLVNQHSPEAIPKNLVPWPFRSLVFGKDRKSYTNRNDNENDGIDLSLSERQHNHTDVGGVDGGGSD